MDYFYGAIDPLSSIGSPLLKSQITSKNNPEDVSKEFMSIFMAELLKQVFKNQSLLEEQAGAGIYNDIFINQMARDLVEKGLLPSHFSKWSK